HRGGDRGAVVAAGDGDVDVVGRRAVERRHEQVDMHHLTGRERIVQGLVEGVAPRPGDRIEGVGPVAAGQRGGRLEMVLAAVDVVHRQLTRVAWMVRRGVGSALFPYTTLFRSHRGGDRGAVVAAGDGDVDVVGRRAVERG